MIGIVLYIQHLQVQELQYSTIVTLAWQQTRNKNLKVVNNERLKQTNNNIQKWGIHTIFRHIGDFYYHYQESSSARRLTTTLYQLHLSSAVPFITAQLANLVLAMMSSTHDSLGPQLDLFTFTLYSNMKRFPLLLDPFNMSFNIFLLLLLLLNDSVILLWKIVDKFITL